MDVRSPSAPSGEITTIRLIGRNPRYYCEQLYSKKAIASDTAASKGFRQHSIFFIINGIDTDGKPTKLDDR